MKNRIKKITDSAVFWIIVLIIVLLLMSKNLFPCSLNRIVNFLLLRSGYLAPLILPMIFFYLFVKKHRNVFLQMALFLLIIWGILAFSYFMFINFGWFQEGKYGPSGMQGIYFIVLFISIYLVAFIAIAIRYLIFCLKIIEEGDATISWHLTNKLWRQWCLGFLTMLILGYLYQLVLQGLILKPSYFTNYRDIVFYSIGDNVGFSLQWLIVTLPATLKMTSMLSKATKR